MERCQLKKELTRSLFSNGSEKERMEKVGMLDDVVFREIREADASSIHAVALEAWRYTYDGIFDQHFIENFVNRNYSKEAILSLIPQIKSGSMFFSVAQYGSKVIGFCNIGIAKQSAQLYRIYILPDFIGQGIGQKFLELGETFVVAHGLDSYFCYVHKNNEIGKQFYLKSRFRHIFIKDKDDEWFMEKKLSKIEG